MGTWVYNFMKPYNIQTILSISKLKLNLKKIFQFLYSKNNIIV